MGESDSAVSVCNDQRGRRAGERLISIRSPRCFGQSKATQEARPLALTTIAVLTGSLVGTSSAAWTEPITMYRQGHNLAPGSRRSQVLIRGTEASIDSKAFVAIRMHSKSYEGRVHSHRYP